MLRIGIVGAGLYGVNHLEALKQREKYIGDVKVIGFAEIDPKKRSEIENRFSVKGYPDHINLLQHESLDGVTVVTPDHLHYQIVMDCLDYGVPVLVEKPLATDVSEAKAMAEKARNKDLLLQVDFHKRFDPYHIDLKLRIEEGQLGKILYGYCWMEDVLRVGTDMIGKSSWGTKGSPGWFLAIHMIDLSYWLLGMPKPIRVHATGFKGKLSSLGIDIYDAIKAEVLFDNGTVITYDCCVVLPNNFEAVVHQGIKLIGTEGFMEVDSQYRGARCCTTTRGMETPNLGMMYRSFDKEGNLIKKGYFSDSICDFIENLLFLRQGHTLSELEGRYASAQQGVESTKIGVAIHQSAAMGGIPIDISNW
jgi:predicted dehydrogenase